MKIAKTLLLLFFIFIQPDRTQCDDEDNGPIILANGTLQTNLSMNGTVEGEFESEDLEADDKKTLKNVEAAFVNAKIELIKAREDLEEKKTSFEMTEERKRNATQKYGEAEKLEMEAKLAFDAADREYKKSLEEWKSYETRLSDAQKYLKLNNTEFEEAEKEYNKWKDENEKKKDELRKMERKMYSEAESMSKIALQEIREDESLLEKHHEDFIKFIKINGLIRKKMEVQRQTSGLEEKLKVANETFKEINERINHAISKNREPASFEDEVRLWRRRADSILHKMEHPPLKSLEELRMITAMEELRITYGIGQAERYWIEAYLNLKGTETNLNQTAITIAEMEQNLEGVDIREMEMTHNEAIITILGRIGVTRRRIESRTQQFRNASSIMETLNNKIDIAAEMDRAKLQKLEMVKEKLRTSQQAHNNIKSEVTIISTSMKDKEGMINEKNVTYASAIQAAQTAKANLDEAENTLNLAKDEKIKAAETLIAKNQAKIDAEKLVREKTEEKNKLELVKSSAIKSGGVVLLCVTIVHLIWNY